ncbi:Nicotinamidase-related amidase [Chitinophaga eiseniae]|uniref:Nicotinamidase-related amidase n=1 Tax=Chitinophaga eiseniae TaxID=634771 RepID=A0A1T4QS85_9BACT|nr:cysteine hydrolase family protein [Chitinophaga eiseniae]SKA06351.1 Nicotinamidase-related amidase [Chitinophaga eiseniae]
MNIHRLRVSVLALVLLFLTGNVFAQNKKSDMKKQALLIIDVQNDYFKGGKMELVGPDAAAANIRLIADKCRQEGIPVIYIQHKADPSGGFLIANTPGADIYSAVQPLAGEKIVVKHYPNSFRETELLAHLQQTGITDLIITGMMTHACVDATTRAAKDYGFNCTVVTDACATRDLEVNRQTVPAAEVQRSLMGALGFFYASIVNTQAYLQ